MKLFHAVYFLKRPLCRAAPAMSAKPRSQFGVKAVSILLFTALLFLNPLMAQSQNSEYEQALAKFTGAKKYDIEKSGAMDGITAPVFHAKTIAGKNINLAKLRGKVVVLNFWFIACAPCRVEIPALNALVEQFQTKDVLFLSIARENEQALKTHLNSTKFLFQTIADPEAALSGKTFHLFGYPTTIVIDKLGKIRYYSLGGKINEEAVHKEFQAKLVPIINESLSDSLGKF